MAKATQADLAARGLMQHWLEDERVLLSHRSRLLAKDPAFYAARFPGTPQDLLSRVSAGLPDNCWRRHNCSRTCPAVMRSQPP